MRDHGPVVYTGQGPGMGSDNISLAKWQQEASSTSCAAAGGSAWGSGSGSGSITPGSGEQTDSHLIPPDPSSSSSSCGAVAQLLQEPRAVGTAAAAHGSTAPTTRTDHLSGSANGTAVTATPSAAAVNVCKQEAARWGGDCGGGKLTSSDEPPLGLIPPECQGVCIARMKRASPSEVRLYWKRFVDNATTLLAEAGEEGVLPADGESRIVQLVQRNSFMVRHVALLNPGGQC
jgi:hypothetical protein